MDARSGWVLETLVRLYIARGEPVGSRLLARQCGLDVSPATVRNIVADLEEQGMVRSPHTSAGRVPTARGYRWFVELLGDRHQLDSAERERIRAGLLQQAYDFYHLYQGATRLLSGLTHYVGIVLVPRPGQGRLRHMELFALPPQRVLAVLVTTAGLVHNRFLDVDREYGPAELEQAANYLNEQYAGWPLHAVKRDLARTPAEEGAVAEIAVRLGWTALDVEEEKEGFIEGQGNLLDYPELAERDRLRELFEVLEEPEEMARVLGAASDNDADSSEVSLMIGEEAGHEALEACSVVTADYGTGGEGYGRVAVIGPARMNYADTIPFVGCTARELASVLAQNRPPNEPYPV